MAHHRRACRYDRAVTDTLSEHRASCGEAGGNDILAWLDTSPRSSCAGGFPTRRPVAAVGTGPSTAATPFPVRPRLYTIMAFLREGRRCRLLTGADRAQLAVSRPGTAAPGSPRVGGEP